MHYCHVFIRPAFIGGPFSFLTGPHHPGRPKLRERLQVRNKEVWAIV
jgi:hypothetical protein